METKLKFKVGDKVRVKSLEWYNSKEKDSVGSINFEKNFTATMSKKCGCILTIRNIYDDYYIVNESMYCWQDWMLEDDVVTEEPVTEEAQEVEQLNKNSMETKEMTKEEFLEYLNMTKILCKSVEETANVQKKLFELGIKWHSDENAGIDDVVNEDAFLLFVEKKYLFFDGDISYWVQDDSRIIEPSEILAIQIKEEPKPKFDPNTLQPFDKVLVREDGEMWMADFFDYYDGAYNATSGHSWNYCIPYNEETKHLHGTCDEAPEFYQVWK